MTLMTATDSQVDQAIRDLNVSGKKVHNMDYLPLEDDNVFQETDFSTHSSSSGRTTPSEAVTPPNGLEATVNIARIDGRQSPPFLSLLEPPKAQLTNVPDIQVTKASIPAKEPSTVGVKIRAPQIYDAFAPASTRLRYMIKNRDKILVCPGVYDGLSARIAINVGFEGMYMTGAGTNASRLGMADLGIAHLHDMKTNAEMIANLKPDGPPLIADMDTGYGGPMVIDRSLQQYHVAGVAGFHIEDQVMQKRCGHLAGKEVVDIDTYISRIKACVAAAKRLRSDIVIIARTDALQSKGYDDCIARLRRARDEGADMGILEGFSSKEQARQAVKDLAPWPLCLNSVENGVSPLISVDEAQDMGFRVVIFSFAATAPAYTAIKNTFEWLKEYGVTGSDVSPKTIFNVCGLQDLMVIDEQAGGNSFKKGV
jgi:methylisocitrate lyase